MVEIWTDEGRIPAQGIKLRQDLDIYASELVFNVNDISVLRSKLYLKQGNTKYRLYVVSLMQYNGMYQVMCHAFKWYELQQQTFGPICKRGNFQQYCQQLGLPVKKYPNSSIGYYSHPQMSIADVFDFIESYAFLEGGGVHCYMDILGAVQVVDLKKSFLQKDGVPFSGDREKFSADLSWRKDIVPNLECHFYTEEGYDSRTVSFDSKYNEKRILHLICNKDQEETKINFYRNQYYSNYYRTEQVTFENVRGFYLLPGSMVTVEGGKRLWMVKSMEGMIDSTKGGLKYTIMSCPE